MARRHVADACVGLPADTVDVARLLVTELVTNAVRHSEGPMALVIGRDGTDLRVEVHDGSPTMPAVIAESASLRDHGAGLRLVETLSSEWGFAPSGDGNPGKSVWFALR